MGPLPGRKAAGLSILARDRMHSAGTRKALSGATIAIQFLSPLALSMTSAFEAWVSASATPSKSNRVGPGQGQRFHEEQFCELVAS